MVTKFRLYTSLLFALCFSIGVIDPFPGLSHSIGNNQATHETTNALGGLPLSADLAAVSGLWYTNNAGGGDRISMLTATNGWIVRFASNVAFLSRWNGSTWSPAGSVNHTQTIGEGDILVVSPTDGWLVLRGAVSMDPPATSIFRWNGTSWNLWAVLDPGTPGTALQRLAMVSSNDIWAAAPDMFGTKFYHWTGSSWNAGTYLCCNINVGWDLDMVSSTDGWAVGYSGQVARWNGSDWVIFTDLGDDTLLGIDMITADDGWIVGRQGTIYHWNGSTWNPVTSPVNADLYEIDMVNAADGWAVGESAFPIHWDGQNWKTIIATQYESKNMVQMISDIDGWIISDSYTYRYKVASLLVNYQTGRPGSYFNLIGSSYPADTSVNLSVNGRPLTSELMTDSSGVFTATLSTSDADPGHYFVTASTNPSATTSFALDPAEPLRPLEGTWPAVNLPTGIAFDQFMYLPIVTK